MADFNITFDKDGNVLEGNVGFSWTFGTCQGKKNVTYSSTEPSWLTVEAYQGRNDAILITAKPTTQVGARNGDVTIKLNGNDCTTIAVTQNGTGCECTTAFVPVAIGENIPVGGGNNITLGNYTYSADCITISPNGSSNANWIRDIRVSNGTIIGNVEGNPNKGSRGPVTITVSGQMKSDSSWCTPSLQVSQDGTGCECGDSTFKITTESPIQIQSEGGNFEFSYIASDCVKSVSDPTVSGGEGWISGLELLRSDKKVTGTVSSYSEATPRSARITIKGTLQDGTTECQSSINIEQTGVNKCKCEDIDEITFITLSDTGYTTTTNVIGHWSKKSTSTCTGIPTITSTDLPSIAANNDGTITIGPLADNPDFKEKTFIVSISYNGEDCGTRKIKQDGKLKCDCDHANYFIRTLKTTFTFSGTNGQTMLIGSGKTSCGSIKLITTSIMVEGNELIIEPLTDGEFNIKANILPTTESRATGIVAELYDEEGVKLDSCNTDWGLEQSATACECGMWPSPGGVLSWDSPHIYIDDEYWIDASHPSTSYPTFSSPWNESCKAAYVDYDETLWKNSSGRHLHWLNGNLNPSSFSLQARDGLVIEEPIHTTVSLTWYVDVEFDGDEMTTGFPCVTHTYNFVIWDGSCSCFIECGYYQDLGPYWTYIDAEGGQYSGYAYSYCDDVEFRYELEFPWGVEPWATVAPAENDSSIWILTFETNTTTEERSVGIKAYPIIDGVECGCWSYVAHIEQEYDQCVDCQTAMQKFTSRDWVSTPTCDQSNVTDIAPSSYNGKCGYDVYEIIAASPESALTHAVTGVNRYMTVSGLSEQTEDWVFTYETFIGVFRNNKWSPRYSDCKRTQTLTVKKCEPQGCSCENRSTEYSFTKATLQEEYSNNFGRLKIGTVDIINAEDSCLEYQAVSTQPDFVTTEPISSNREVWVNIGDIGSEDKVRVDLKVNLRDTAHDKECATGEVISFFIKK